MTTVQAVVAAAVAVSIVRDARAEVHQTPETPEAELKLITNHTTKVLAELGLTRSEVGDDTTQAVRREVKRRGGWSKQAQAIVYQFMANCLQCPNDEFVVRDYASHRKGWINDHTEETGHTVIQRWEQPTAL